MLEWGFFKCLIEISKKWSQKLGNLYLQNEVYISSAKQEKKMNSNLGTWEWRETIQG